jgi:hypothetical protein
MAHPERAARRVADPEHVTSSWPRWPNGAAPIWREVATTWGELQADAAHRGRTPPQNDTWIAACCLVEGLPLATLNLRDYASFAEHDGLALIGG